MREGAGEQWRMSQERSLTVSNKVLDEFRIHVIHVDCMWVVTAVSDRQRADDPQRHSGRVHVGTVARRGRGCSGGLA
jgi:hypothetical protein